MAGVQPTGFLAKRKTTKKDAWFGTFSPILDKERGGDLFAGRDSASQIALMRFIRPTSLQSNSNS